MKNYKLDTSAGSSFDRVAKKAKEIGGQRNCNVEFDFNGRKVIVSSSTDLALLYRDYSNSWTMDWKVIGPDCLPVYEPEVQQELEKRRKQEQENEENAQIAYNEKERLKAIAFEEKVKDIQIELKDKALFDNQKETNTDPYGAAVVQYAENWGHLMQFYMKDGSPVKDIAEKASSEADTVGGITGFMYGCAVQILSQCWIHGEDLRKWHNKEYGVSEDKKGVVNPAILSVKI